ncbi:MAG: mechanosensitive ion channel family protein [Pseudoscardovia radai]|nr:mechanosensitive ion channel family protein [Pseudoscardovia radai]
MIPIPTALPTTAPLSTATLSESFSDFATGNITDNITSNIVVQWFLANLNRIIFLVVALIVTWLIERTAKTALRKALDRSNIPSASIFVNCARILIWFTFLLVVLKPVFGIEPTTLVTALGVSGIALSFGLKDTIANIIGGFGLMVGKVVQPGDMISVSGYTGRVKDLTWRNTIVVSRDGNEFWIPNSVLNTAGLTKMTKVNESVATVEFTVRGDRDLEVEGRRLADAIERATADMRIDGHPCVVRFSGFSPYGAEGKALIFARREFLPSVVQDRAARAIAGMDCLVVDGAASVGGDAGESNEGGESASEASESAGARS